MASSPRRSGSAGRFVSLSAISTAGLPITCRRRRTAIRARWTVPTPGNVAIINWDTWRTGWPGSKRAGQQIEGPCPVTGDGTNCCHVNLDTEAAGCRKCGDGAGKLTGDQLVAHAREAGAVDNGIDLGGRRWPSWTWTAADGRKRRQYRAPDGKKWEKTDPPNTPRPGELIYLPAGIPDAPGPIYVTEGASDADAVHKLGLPVIGRTNARPSAESLARLPRGATYRVWPDVDDDHAGYRQAIAWYNAATAAGLRCEVIDPLALQPDAPAGYDARNWIDALPDGTDAAGAAARLETAAGGIETIRGQIPTLTAVDGFPAAVQAALDSLTDDGLGGVAARLRTLADACGGLDGGARLAVRAAARIALKNDLKMLASESAEQIGIAFASGDEPDQQGRRIHWTETKPADSPQPLAVILDRIGSGVTERIYLPDGAADVIACYVALCYVFEHWPIRPLLAISSPVKQCGKTTLLDLIAMLIPRAYPTGGITAAALFRMIEAHRPTLLLDECDQWLHGAGAKSEKAGELIACINQGWRVGGEVARCVGDEHEPRGFRVDTLKILFGIGDFPDTIADRAVILSLERKPGDLELVSVRADRPIGAETRAQLTRWAADSGDTFAGSDPAMGRWTNRAADNWRPLFAIADMAGGEWPARIRWAADAVTGRAAARATSTDYRTMLLMDCRRVFDEAGCPFLISKMFDSALHTMEDRPWGDWRGKPLSPQRRGQWLTGFGILAGKNERDERGYHRRDFEGAWQQYGTPPPGTVETVETVERPVNVDRAVDGLDGFDGSIQPAPLPSDLPPGALGSANGGGDASPGASGSTPADDRLLDTLASVLRDPAAHQAAAPSGYCQFCHVNRAMVPTPTGLLLCPPCRTAYNAMGDTSLPALIADAEAAARRCLLDN